jgi:glutamyl-tRNA synthetase
MEITHVIRGTEWISSTPKHIILYEMFGWELPSFCHLPILMTENNQKLSKRQGHSSINWYKEQGYLPEALINFVSLLGF